MQISFQKILSLELSISSRQEHHDSVTGAGLKVFPNERHKSCFNVPQVIKLNHLFSHHMLQTLSHALMAATKYALRELFGYLRHI